MLDANCGIKADIKPPNDVLIGGKKICGILTEKTGDSLIIGVGLNVNNPSFPADLPATSLFIICAREFDLDDLLSGLLDEIRDRYLKFLSGKV